MRLYNEEVMYEKKILEQVYINLWRLSLVVSAKRAKYFIMLMNSISTFIYTSFLKEKMIEMALEVLKKYMTKTERLIEQRV